MSEGLRVLIVDDHQMFADAIELLLAGEIGIEAVGTAGSGEEALALCERTEPDVVLMDVDLPGIDGIEACRRVREMHPATQVVIITAVQPADVLARAIEAGACGFIPKTRAAHELINVIRRAASGEMVLPPGGVDQVLRRLQRAIRAQPEPEGVTRLTAREVEILQELAEGKSTGEVASTLSISPHTVQSHIRSILTKLGVRSKLEAVLVALRQGLIRLPSNA
jgi:DNA-binding NarL/FixJ family response regulator